MLSIFKNNAIKKKLIYSIALVHGILMTVFVFDLVQRQHDFLMQESFAIAEGYAKTLATNSRQWILTNDLAGLEEIIQSQAQLPNVNFAILTNPEGKILAYFNSQNPSEQRTGEYITPPKTVSTAEPFVYANNGSAVDIIIPIILDQTQIGWARMQMSRENIDGSIRLITTEGVFYTLFAILIGILIAWFISNGLTTGIYRLIEATQKAKNGERNIKLSMPTNDELQTLSINFEAMLKEIESNEKALYEEKERAEITLNSIGDGVITTNAQGKINYLNPVAEKLLGWSNSAANTQFIEDIFKIYNEYTMEKAVNPALHAMQTRTIVGLASCTILINHAGEKIAIEDTAAPIIDKEGNIMGAVLVFHDATEERQLHKRLNWQASHDSLTQLYNRQAFENKLDELIESCQFMQCEHSLIYIDLDQFKIVNDTVGHSAGDELLKQVAVILEKQIRGSDFLARIGGDEFAILLQNCSTQDAEAIAEKVRISIAQHRFPWENRIFEIGSSLGIATIAENMNKAAIMSQADIACYFAKDNGRNQIHIYREDDQQLDIKHRQLDWVSKIKTALSEKRFLLFAQEITPLQSTSTMKRFEILVRLKNSEGNIVPPDEFLPAAERFNLMGALDTYIIEHAINWLKIHQDKISILNINVSGQSLNDATFNRQLLERLQEDKKLNQKICFEITETAAITHMSASIAFLNIVKNHGCKLALDDFGSGFSSFNWLKNLPVDFVKIDGTFILDVLTDKVDAEMVRAIHRISQEMHIESIAEFVENQMVADWLTACGIEYAQGYHFSKPTPIEHIFKE